MNRFLQITAAIFCFVVLLLLNIGCKHEKTYRIGISQCSEDDWRRKMNDEIQREAMLHQNVSVEIRSADDSSQKQIEDIRYFVENDFDILIISPNESDALTPVIKEVYDNGTPVIIFDRNINGDSYTAYVGADNTALGRSAAEYALSTLNKDKPKAIEILGLPGSSPAVGRHEGFNDYFCSNGGTVLASVTGRWNQEDASRVADSLLNLYDDVDLIYAHNDRMAIGASEVAKRKGRRDIEIIGIDAAPEIGIQAVADSVIDATFLYPTEGYKLFRIALAVLNGEPYQRENVLPSSSAVDHSNANILLLQNQNLVDETERMKLLKARIDEYWAQHSSQTLLLYASIAIIILLMGVTFLILRSFWQHQRHRKALLAQNKELEEERDKQRELNAKLEEATQSKLIFFTNVSHDLRTPLTLIAEPVAQLAEADNITPQQKSLIKIADKNVRILRRLINQILDFRKYENGKLQITLSEVYPGRLVGDWLESFNALARKRQIKLSADIQPDTTEMTIAIDVEKIERVFFNLVSNAFKYTPANGSITITCRYEEDSLVIKVADTGEGISSRDLGKIFDRFYQVDRVHPNGSGIGLSLCKAFVELHGGKIEVESTQYKGSEFTVTIPVRHVEATVSQTGISLTGSDVEAELDVAEEDITFDENKPLLLIIDDNKDIQQLITELMNESYNVITACNGAEGVRKAVKYVPDLIICDMMMPVMDGLECCRRLKEEVATSHIPVLMLTACSMDEQRVQGYESGADGYLAKPFSSKVLTARCTSLLDNRKRIKNLWSRSDRQTGASDSTTAGGKETAKTLPVSDIDNDFYIRFLSIFNEQIGDSTLSVDSLAAQMGLERTQFYRKIKSLTNFSPVELIRNLRLKQARKLIQSIDKSMSEIAYEVGFSTPAYFTRCYRECYGETPTETRNSLHS